MEDAGATVLKFPLLPRMRIRAIVERCPALGSISCRLPPEDDGRRGACERVLAHAFTLLLHLPDLTREQADVVLDHETDPEVLAADELSRLHHEADTAERYELWREVWAAEEDDVVRAFARYVVALVARLYRLEHFAKRERLVADEGLAARSA